jgi:RIO-like serine/threonine protein kinase
MYSTERIFECSVIFNTVPCTALKEYLNIQLSSIQYHAQHWKNIQMFSYLQYGTMYSTERISECSVVFNTVPCTALKQHPDVHLSSIRYHVQHWKNIWMFSYLQYSTMYSTKTITKCSVIFNTVPCTALKEYMNVQLSSIQYQVQHWKNIWMFS